MRLAHAIAAAVVLCAPPGSAPAQQKPTSPTPAFELAETPITDTHRGLALRLFTDTAELPVRRLADDDIRNLYWYEGQCLRSWVVQRGGRDRRKRLRVILGELRFPATREWLSGNWKPPVEGDPAAGWDTRMRAAWIQTFAEMRLAAAPADRDVGGRTRWVFDLVSQRHRGRGYLLAKTGRNHDRTRFLLYKWPIDWHAEPVQRAVDASAASWNDAAIDIDAEESPAGPPQVRRLDGMPAVPSNDPAAAARARTRLRVERDLRGLPSWWYAMTPHYCLVSNLDPTDASQATLIRDLARGLERVNTAYQAIHPPVQPLVAVSVVKIFNHRDQLFAHFSERAPMKIHAGIIGMWVNVYDELVLSHDPAAARPANTFNTLYHEGFHQYAHYALARISVPRWFDEGTGDFFGGAIIDADGVRIGENRTRRNVITNICNGNFKARYGWDHPPLARLVAMSRADFYAEVKWQVFMYAMAWSLVYYLHKGVDDDSPYAGAIDRFVAALQRRESQEAAVRAAFGRIDMAALERDWKAFWNDPAARKRAAARRLIPAVEDPGPKKPR